MDIITRKDWGARKRKSAPETVAPATRRAVMAHHSTGEELGREDYPEWVRQIQTHHMDVNGWQDIGYNFLVSPAGDIFEGRGWDAVGAHCSGYNAPAIGVCVLGEYGTGTVTDAAMGALVELLAEAERRAGHDLEQEGHRDRFSTACPGSVLYQRWTGRDLSPAKIIAPLQPPQIRSVAPRWPLPAGRYFGPGSVTRSASLGHWQRQMRRRGWTLRLDGIYGPQTADVARAFQREKGLTVDGLIGPKTWAAAFTAPIT